jgi:hypothetical protein
MPWRGRILSTGERLHAAEADAITFVESGHLRELDARETPPAAPGQWCTPMTR